MISHFAETPLRSLELLSKKSRLKFWAAVIVQSSLSLLDLIGVLLTGVIGVLVASELQSEKYPEYIQGIISVLNLGNLRVTEIILIISIASLFFLVAKSLLSLMLSKKIFEFLGNEHFVLSERVISNFMKSDYIWMTQQDPHKVANTISLGLSAASVNMIGQTLMLIAESMLLLTFVILMVVVSPTLALLAVAYLCFIIIMLNLFIGKKVTEYNESMRDDLNSTKQQVFNSILLFREIRVFGRQETFAKNLENPIDRFAKNNAKDIWIQQVPKYAMEIALLLGMTLIMGIATVSAKPEDALPTLLIYTVAAARIFPILLRIQASILSIRSHSPLVNDAFTLIEDLSIYEQKNIFQKKNRSTKDRQIFLNIEALSDTEDLIEVKNAVYMYPKKDSAALIDINLKIHKGDRVALVGGSGAGKSTLCDLILGLITPDKGSVHIDGLPSVSWIEKNPGRASYLPQETIIIPGTIEQNICLGIDKSEFDKSRLDKAIMNAQLLNFIESLPAGTQTLIGDGYSKLSGGQKQRLGIARALYSNPAILVMDEATSALDAETESDIMRFLNSLDKEITLILIAHRLSSIKKFRRIIYMEEGVIKNEGTFEQLRETVESFNVQANLLQI